MNDDQIHNHLARAEQALADLEQLPPPAVRAAMDGIESVVRVYAEGLTRMVDIVAGQDPTLGDHLVSDPLVAHLLLLHDLHPHSLERRVRDAVERARPTVAYHGARVELLSVEPATVTVKISGGGASAPLVAASVEDAIHQVAPEIEEVVVEGDTRAPEETVIPVDALFSKLDRDRAPSRSAGT